MAKKKPAGDDPPRLIIKQQKQAAIVLKTTDRTLRDWAKAPDFPRCAGGYDIVAILHWRLGQDRFDDVAEARRNISLAKEEAAMRREITKAEQEERAAARDAGRLVDREEVELFVAETIGAARDTFARIPHQLAGLACRKCQASIEQEAQTLVRLTLDDLARLEEGGGDDDDA